MMNKLYNPYDPYNSCSATNTDNPDNTKKSNSTTTNNTNKLYNNIYKNLINDIRNIDFIESLSNDKKMEIILLYNKIVESNKKLLDELLHKNLLR